MKRSHVPDPDWDYYTEEDNEPAFNWAPVAVAVLCIVTFVFLYAQVVRW